MPFVAVLHQNRSTKVQEKRNNMKGAGIFNS